MNLPDIFWSSSIDEIKKGYKEVDGYLICLLCGEKIEKGIIYKVDDIMYEAGKYMLYHIIQSHKSVFYHLSNLDKKLTGLTEHQNSLLKLFYDGKNDNEIQKALGVGSSSTIRNHRFLLRERERQSRIFVAMMDLLKEKDSIKISEAYVHKSFNKPLGKTISKRGKNLRDPESKSKWDILNKYLPNGLNGILTGFPTKQNHRKVIVEYLAQLFEAGVQYTEKEVNDILCLVHDDYVRIRRYLIDYGYLDRKADGSKYWLRSEGNFKIDRKKELKELYKDTKIEAGVFQIKNNVNQKILLCSTNNLKTINGKLFQLEIGSHKNKELQKEWKEYGKEAFTVEILEILKEEDTNLDTKDGLKKLESKWLDKLEPYGDKGYNTPQTH